MDFKVHAGVFSTIKDLHAVFNHGPVFCVLHNQGPARILRMMRVLKKYLNAPMVIMCVTIKSLDAPARTSV